MMTKKDLDFFLNCINEKKVKLLKLVSNDRNCGIKKLRQHRTTIKKAGTQPKAAYLLLTTVARANFIKPASFSCQPDRDSPMRI